VERRRPRHPHPEGSQGGVRETAVACRSCSVRPLLRGKVVDLRAEPAGSSGVAEAMKVPCGGVEFRARRNLFAVFRGMTPELPGR
jgi:hypothetical protein